MVRVKITKDMIDRAEAKAKKFVHDGRTIDNDPKKVVNGYIAEYAVHSIAPWLKHVDREGYDFESPSGLKIEVKSSHYARTDFVKGTDPIYILIQPNSFFRLSLINTNVIGVVISRPEDVVIIVGWIDALKFTQACAWRREGERQAVTGFEYKCDSYEIDARSQMEPVSLGMNGLRLGNSRKK